MDLGTATKEKLKSLKVSDEQKLKFQKSCLNMLKVIVQKLQTRSPLKYPVVINSKCLAPTQMVDAPESCKLLFNALVDKILFNILVDKLLFNAQVDKLFSCRWLTEKHA